MAKRNLKIKFAETAVALKEKAQKESELKEWLDVTAPGKKASLGHLHPLTQKIGSTLFSACAGPKYDGARTNKNSKSCSNDK